MNLNFLVFIREMREGGESKKFLCYPKGSGTSHQSFQGRGGAFSARGVFVSGGWFLLEVQLDSGE